MATLYTVITALLHYLFKLTTKTDTFFGGLVIFSIVDFLILIYVIYVIYEKLKS